MGSEVGSEKKKTIPKPRHDANPLRIPAAPDPTLTAVREGAKVTPQNVATKFKIMPAEHCWHGTGPVPNALLMLAVRCSGLVCHRNNTSWAMLHHKFHMAFPKIKTSCSHHFCPRVVLLMSGKFERWTHKPRMLTAYHHKTREFGTICFTS